MVDFVSYYLFFILIALNALLFDEPEVLRKTRVKNGCRSSTLVLVACICPPFFTNGFEAIKHDLVELYHLATHPTPTDRRQQGQQTQAASTSSSKGTGYVDLWDSYAPVNSGQPSDYEEWREDPLVPSQDAKRSNERALNIVGSFTGLTLRSWRKKTLSSARLRPWMTPARSLLPTSRTTSTFSQALYVAEHGEAYRKSSLQSLAQQRAGADDHPARSILAKTEVTIYDFETGARL